MLNGAIFDMDGTLLDSMPMWDKIGETFLRSMHITPRRGLREEMLPLTLLQSAEYFRREYGINMSDDEMLCSFNELLFGYYSEEAPLKPYVREFLEKLRTKGVKMCVATATERSLVEAALKRLDISKYFEFLITCREAGANKNTPVIFDCALELLGTEKRDTVIFEDAFHAIRAAKGAGYRVCAVNDLSAKGRYHEITALADWHVDTLDRWEIDLI